jgi:hypothetical protein
MGEGERMRDTRAPGEYLSLSTPMFIATVIWLVGNNYKDMTAPMKLSILVRCFIELGILRSSPAIIWRRLNRTSVPATFPGTKFQENALCVLLACRPSAHWMSSAERWIDDNRDMLIASRALNPEAPRMCVLRDD